MTDNRRLKRLVRERMERTGEKYTVALRAVKEDRSEPEPDRPRMVEIHSWHGTSVRRYEP